MFALIDVSGSTCEEASVTPVKVTVRCLTSANGTRFWIEGYNCQDRIASFCACYLDPTPGRKGDPSSIMKNIFLLFSAFCLLLSNFAYAGSATWKLSPASGDWNTAANWTPATVPNGPSDTATFGSSGKISLSFSAEVEVNTVTFNLGASGYSITSTPTNALTISGAGVVNNSGVTQEFVANQDESGNGFQTGITFRNNATAGSATSFSVIGGAVSDYGSGGVISFWDNASADHAAFEIFGSVADAFQPARVNFNSTSTAASASFIVHHGDGGWNGELNFVGGDGGAALITNDGSSVSFGPAGSLEFPGDAADSTITNNGARGSGNPLYYVGTVTFRSTSTANHATVTNNGGQYPGDASYGQTAFIDSSSAGSATFINNGGVGLFAHGGLTKFPYGNATASNAICIANGGVTGGSPGEVLFTSFFAGDLITAGNATLIANGSDVSDESDGGIISFEQNSYGGTARIEVFGNGTLNIGAHDPPGITTGSLEGDGFVLLGANNLTLGSNNLSTTFAGAILDVGSITKTGAGNLTLTSGNNSYSGGTSVNGGILLANNVNGSATGKGPVQVNAGTLGGSGIISGAVVVGTGNGAGAFLAPGARGVTPGTLTIRKKLTLMSDSTYKVTLDSRVSTADAVRAKGVRIQNGAILFNDLGTNVLSSGTIFTIINNLRAGPISGRFSNLADSATVTIGSNTFLASYEGGDGNDLTLTVVP
jgi:autotransporter-associated beta strand protein